MLFVIDWVKHCDVLDGFGIGIGIDEENSADDAAAAGKKRTILPKKSPYTKAKKK